MAAETIKFERVMYELKPRPATVKSIEDLTSSYRRIVMTGDALADFQSASPMDHIKVKIEVGDGTVMRDYTPRSFADGELTLEFAIHADGPLTNWARNAEIGSEATILGPRGSVVFKGGIDAGVLIGDDTFLPTVGRAAEMYSDVALLAIIEVDGPEDEIELPAGTQVIWAHKGNRLPGEALVEALAAATLPVGEVLFLAGGEATAMRDVRRHLLNDRGVPRENIRLSGHWKRGESNFDHHAEIEE